MLKNYKDSLFNDELLLRSQQRFRSDHHKGYTEEVNKIALSSYDDKKYKHLIKLLHIHMVQVFLQSVKMK